MRVLAFCVLSISLLMSGCATAPSTQISGHAATARLQDLLAEDYKNTGDREQAQYHADKARQAREAAINEDCFLCGFIDAR